MTTTNTSAVNSGIGSVGVGMNDKAIQRSISRLCRGVDGMGTMISALQDGVSRAAKPHVTFTYDIPKRLSRVCPNPSGLLWRFGFRLQLSQWILPLEAMDHPAIRRLLALWHQHKVKVNWLDFSERTAGRVRELAAEMLREHLIEVHTSLIRSIGKADDEFNALRDKVETTARQLHKGADVRLNNMRSAVRLAGEKLAASIKCAEVYDNTENVADLLDGLRNAINASRIAVAAAARTPTLPRLIAEPLPTPPAVEAAPFTMPGVAPAASAARAETVRQAAAGSVIPAAAPQTADFRRGDVVIYRGRRYRLTWVGDTQYRGRRVRLEFMGGGGSFFVGAELIAPVV